jgi:hypothetical protein
MTCVSRDAAMLSVSGDCIDDLAVVRCVENGQQTNPVENGAACDCTNPAAFETLPSQWCP